jgi:hypothetical protein
MADQLPEVLATMRSLGYVVFDGGPHDLNIVGIRSAKPVVNTFCDRLCVFYREVKGGPWVSKSWAATTNPGTYWLQNPMHASGTGILVPGQYRNSHSIGMHRGSYQALVQTGKLKLWLDANKDNVLDHDPARVIEGKGYGINIHHAGTASTKVDKWSAGCIVFANLADFDEFMFVANKAAAIWGPTFTLTLLQAT